jgi:hypothetical protein
LNLPAQKNLLQLQGMDGPAIDRIFSTFNVEAFSGGPASDG